MGLAKYAEDNWEIWEERQRDREQKLRGSRQQYVPAQGRYAYAQPEKDRKESRR